MQHLQLILYVLLLSTGFAGITVSSIFWYRTREPVLLVMVLVISLFSLGLVLFAGLFYLDEIVVYPLEIDDIVGYANAVIVLGMYVGIALCLRLTARPHSRRALVLAAIPVAATYVTFVFVAPWAEPVAQWARRHPNLVTMISVASASLYLGYTGWILRRPVSRHSSESLGFMIHALGWMLLGYAALAVGGTGIVFGINALHGGGLRIDPTIALNFLLFLGWNIVAIIAFLRYLRRPIDLFEDGTIPDETRRRYKISQRESEVILELSRGLSNQEIADRLGVSLTTVRTHVYNIFKKTGAASRVELLRILSSP